MHFALIQTILAHYPGRGPTQEAPITSQYKLTTSFSKANDGAFDPKEAGVLYVVATPIGNLADISQRAIDTLKAVSTILVEDTRHSKRLLNHYGISTRLKACHDHNESEITGWITARLDNGEDLALISDAGTPLISDPGFVVVRTLRESGYRVQAVPGASSITAALSIAGLPTDRFVFDGFLPAKTTARQVQLSHYQTEPRTVVLLESSHRIVASVRDVVEVLGAQRVIALAREITKKFETLLSGEASDVLQQLQADSNQTKGEFVMMIAGVQDADEQESSTMELKKLLIVLLNELPLKQAVSLAVKLTGGRKNDVYQLALSLQDQDE
jgi:16S rRNA (cytidine1402-2'-O)-methyltransferase